MVNLITEADYSKLEERIVALLANGDKSVLVPAGEYHGPTGRIHQSMPEMQNLEPPECWPGCDDPSCPYTH